MPIRLDRGERVRGMPALERQLHLPDLAGEAALPFTCVVLASAHLDHDPGNNRQCNLAAPCQRCHLAQS